MITKKITTKQNWKNLDKSIFDEVYERKVYLFGIRIFKHSFHAEHTGQLGGQKNVGFNK